MYNGGRVVYFLRGMFMKKGIAIALVCIMLGSLSWVGLSAATPKNTAPSWVKDATIYEVNTRQFSQAGTFKAVQQQLPRLKAMGVKILWMMPIHPISKTNRKGTLGSYYAISDYKAVNPEFGTAADYKAFVKKAHAMGFKVIMDWVANHTGWDNPWVTQHKDWYQQDEQGHILSPNDWSDVAWLNYDKPELRAAMIDAMSYWVKNYDIDGFRCDVAGMVPVSFWNEAMGKLRKIKPLFTYAEDNQNNDLLQSAFNANYGWRLYGIMNQLAKGEVDAYSVETTMRYEQNAYPAGTFAMQFVTNHDENSWTGTEYERLGRATNTLTALTFVVPGIPLIYSGQESAFNHRLAFFEKDPIQWGTYKLTPFLKKLIALRKSNPALWSGTYGGAVTLLDKDNDNVLAFERVKGKNKVWVVMNVSNAVQSTTIQMGTAKGTYRSYQTNKKVTFKSTYKVKLQPWAYDIYTANK
jgi:glycosidase